MVREPDATMQPAPQDDQLMSKHRVLGFKPNLRLEWRGQDGQNETEQPDHSASLGDSITSSTRIRFSVHTSGSRHPRSLPLRNPDQLRRSDRYRRATGDKEWQLDNTPQLNGRLIGVVLNMGLVSVLEEVSFDVILDEDFRRVLHVVNGDIADGEGRNV
jgi:hypothetical protein